MCYWVSLQVELFGACHTIWYGCEVQMILCYKMLVVSKTFGGEVKVYSPLSNYIFWICYLR